MSQEFILVSGVTGYIASHVVEQLLKAGHRVRGTVRSLKDESKNKPIKNLVKNAKFPLELVEADLLNAESWKAAVKDITIVLHVASPFPVESPKHEDEVVKPALDGTLNVLKACVDTNVKRVIITSSCLSATGLPFVDNKTYTDQDWGNSNIAWAYCKSKILAEKAAWDFVEERKKQNKKTFELAVVLPSLVLGPILLQSSGGSVSYFLKTFGTEDNKLQNSYFPTCDVRDVASAHIKAAFNPAAPGKRFMIVSTREFIPMSKWVEILRQNFPTGFKIPTEIDSSNENGKTSKIDDSNMRNVLQIKPIDFNKTVIDMANSLVENGIVKKI